MVETRRAPLVPLTPESFAPFGACLVAPESAPDRLAGNHAQLWNLADLEFTRKAPFVGVVRYLKRSFICSTMERHPGETQTFIPLGGASIVAVAPRTDGPLPDPDGFTAFLLDGTRGIMLHRGTWVRHFYPIGEHADYVVVTGRRTKTDDVDNIDLAESLNVQFELLLEG